MAYCSWLAFYAFFLNYKLQYADGPPLIISAIATVVTVAEILKNNGLAVAKKIMTSTVDVKDDSRNRPIQKAKIEIVLGKTEKFDELMAAAEEEREAAKAEEQS